MTAEQERQVKREVTQGTIALTVLAIVGYQAFILACRYATGIWH
jgi:hypothetical protein